MIVISLGGNSDKTRLKFKHACLHIEKNIGNIEKKSSIYVSSPWGFKENVPFFFNQIIVVKTSLFPEKLLEETQHIEKLLGRKNKTQNNQYKSREIDIDILFYKNKKIETEKLTIPHPLIHKRGFILVPLNEILSNFIHPNFQKSIKELLLQCEDKLEVKKLLLNENE